MRVRSWLVELVPFAAMVSVDCLDVGLTTLSKAAMSIGMSHFVLVVYSNALASIILLPSAFFVTRNKRPRITLSLLCKFFLLSIAGITITQNCVFTGADYSSPALASAFANLVPAFTFSLAVTFRMEKLEWISSRSQVKMLGTLLAVSGALLITLYKGPSIIFELAQPPRPKPSPFTFSSSTTINSWMIGGLFIATACLSYSTNNLGQAAILKGYPSEITSVSFYRPFGFVQCTIVTSIAARNNLDAWKLCLEIEFISIIYSVTVTISTFFFFGNLSDSLKSPGGNNPTRHGSILGL